MAEEVSPGQKIEWEHLHSLAARLDEIASVTLAAPDWPKITEDEDTPFPKATTPKKGDELPEFLWLHFELAPGTATVTDQYLAEQPGVVYSLPDQTLQNLRDNDNLFLVTEEDECWCTGIYQLLPREGATCGIREARMDGEEIEGRRCCWSLTIPQVDDTLDDSQSVINHKLVEHWAGRLVNLSGEVEPERWLTRPTCEDDEGEHGETVLKFSHVSGRQYRLTGAARRFAPDYMTWPIRKAWMDRLVDAIDLLGGPYGYSGGAKFQKLTSPFTTEMQAGNIPLNGPLRTVPSRYCPTDAARQQSLLATTEDDEDIYTHIALPGSGIFRYSLSPQIVPFVNPGCVVGFRTLQQWLNCETVNTGGVGLPEDEPPDAPGALTKVGRQPWEESVCEGEECEETGSQQVYAHTYNQFLQIVEALEELLAPFQVGCPDCCFDGVTRLPSPLYSYQHDDISGAKTIDPVDLWETPPSRVIDPDACAFLTDDRKIVMVVQCSAAPQGDARPLGWPDGAPQEPEDAIVCGSAPVGVTTHKYEVVLLIDGAAVDSVVVGGDTVSGFPLVSGYLLPKASYNITVEITDAAPEYDFISPCVACLGGDCEDLVNSFGVLISTSLAIFVEPEGYTADQVREALR